MTSFGSEELMRERLIRFLIVGITALVVLGGVKIWAGQQTKRPKESNLLSFPQLEVKKKLEGLGEEVLGETAKRLPRAPDLEKLELEVQGDQVNEEDQDKKKKEPIKEPLDNVQKQTQVLLETIKRLPEEEMKAIKKQVYKEFCEGLLKE